MKNAIKLMSAFALTGLVSLSHFSFAEETVIEKAETVKNKSGDAVKKGYRNVKDKTCEMINGKLDCTMKKVGNKINNATDDVKTKATEEKNKND